MDALTAYFGYGSLVNRDTLRTDFAGRHRARIRGWRRVWNDRGVDGSSITGPIALLSVQPCPRTVLDGVVIVDRLANLAAVDAREAMYDRRPADPAALDFIDPPTPQYPGECHLYVGRNGSCSAGPRLLQSYLDAVMAGFLAEFGEEGVLRFLATTDGFEREILVDRHAPLYPRAVALPQRVTEWFDGLLAEAGVRFTRQGKFCVGLGGQSPL